MAENDMLSQIGKWGLRNAGGGLDDYSDNLRATITAAGIEDKTNQHKMLGVQIVSSLVVPAVALFIIRKMGMMESLFEGPAQILLYLVLIGFGFYFPIMSLKEKKAKRQKRILRELPDVVDLLTISVEAGLDFMMALKRVVGKIPQGPLRFEFEYFFKQVELGRTREEALKEMSRRVQLTDLSTICSSLIQADRLGTSVGPILRVQSDMLRVRRGQRAEKAAMEAPVKMLGPLLMFIFPSVFLMLFAPIFIQMYQDLTR